MTFLAVFFCYYLYQLDANTNRMWCHNFFFLFSEKPVLATTHNLPRVFFLLPQILYDVYKKRQGVFEEFPGTPESNSMSFLCWAGHDTLYFSFVSLSSLPRTHPLKMRWSLLPVHWSTWNKPTKKKKVERKMAVAAISERDVSNNSF